MLGISQEESDTRMYLHVNFYAKYRHKVDIIIRSPDTGVLVLGIVAAQQANEADSKLFFNTLIKVFAY